MQFSSWLHGLNVISFFRWKGIFLILTPSPHRLPRRPSNPPPSTALSFPFTLIEVNDVSRGRRQGRRARSLKSHHLAWSCNLHHEDLGGPWDVLSVHFPPRSLSRPMQLKTTGGANKHLYVRHRTDRWNKTLPGLKPSLPPPPPHAHVASVETREKWENTLVIVFWLSTTQALLEYRPTDAFRECNSNACNYGLKVSNAIKGNDSK